MVNVINCEMGKSRDCEMTGVRDRNIDDRTHGITALDELVEDIRKSRAEIINNGNADSKPDDTPPVRPSIQTEVKRLNKTVRHSFTF
jgi:hypothetical protein